MTPRFAIICFVFALLRGFSAESNPQRVAPPANQKTWENTLGMKFVSVPGTAVQFCIWKVRVRDFEAFVNATGYDATKDMISSESVGGKRLGHHWKDPGFPQGPTHPVCGVNWSDAIAFCQWLTATGLKSGELKPGQTYRLPTDAEWSKAVGNSRYPWGDDWPPPPDGGNYAGKETKGQPWLGSKGPIPYYRDDFVRTSPVGSFRASADGLYDLGGNLFEWCEDWYSISMNSEAIQQKNSGTFADGGGKQFRVVRGASWGNTGRDMISSACRVGRDPGLRLDHVGFRVVLTTEK